MIKVTEMIWRGPRPASIDDLIAHGFTQVINLQSGAEDRFKDTAYEYQLGLKRTDRFFRTNISLIDIRCSNIFPPSKDQVGRLLSSLGARVSYIHCHSGVDRTGFMVAVYRMVAQGWSFEKAHAEWVAQGRHWWFWWWKFELKKWAKE